MQSDEKNSRLDSIQCVLADITLLGNIIGLDQTKVGNVRGNIASVEARIVGLGIFIRDGGQQKTLPLYSEVRVPSARGISA